MLGSTNQFIYVTFFEFPMEPVLTFPIELVLMRQNARNVWINHGGRKTICYLESTLTFGVKGGGSEALLKILLVVVQDNSNGWLLGIGFGEV